MGGLGMVAAGHWPHWVAVPTRYGCDKCVSTHLRLLARTQDPLLDGREHKRVVGELSQCRHVKVNAPMSSPSIFRPLRYRDRSRSALQRRLADTHIVEWSP